MIESEEMEPHRKRAKVTPCSVIRCGESHKDKNENLISIGSDKSLLKPSYAAVRSALLQFKKMYGDMLVLAAYIVPSDDESWPEATWGMKLGEIVSSIRCGESHKDKNEDLISASTTTHVTSWLNRRYCSTRSFTAI
jgi:hypothetical protein